MIVEFMMQVIHSWPMSGGSLSLEPGPSRARYFPRDMLLLTTTARDDFPEHSSSRATFSAGRARFEARGSLCLFGHWSHMTRFLYCFTFTFMHVHVCCSMFDNTHYHPGFSFSLLILPDLEGRPAWMACKLMLWSSECQRAIVTIYSSPKLTQSACTANQAVGASRFFLFASKQGCQAIFKVQ